MTPFIILAAVLVAAALLFVLPPLLGVGARAERQRSRQQQAQTALLVLREQLAELEREHAAGEIDSASYERSHAELEARALEEGRAVEEGGDGRPSRAAALLIVLAIPLAAALVYAQLGSPVVFDFVPAQQAAGHEGMTREEFSALVDKLVDRIDADPSDPTGWQMLTRSYVILGDAKRAEAAWQRLGAKVPDNADVLVDWADLLVVAQSGKFEGDPQRLIDRALELEPAHPKGLALAGTAAFDAGDYAGAAAAWEKVLVQVPPNDEIYASVLGGINEARSRAGMPAFQPSPASMPAPPAPAEGVPPMAAGPSATEAGLLVKGSVSVTPELADQVKAGQVLFIFARSAEGGPPLAGLRMPVTGELPISFDFREAMLMGGGDLPAQLSLGARLSISGEPVGQPGDLESAVQTVTREQEGVELVIDHVRP